MFALSIIAPETEETSKAEVSCPLPVTPTSYVALTSLLPEKCGIFTTAPLFKVTAKPPALEDVSEKLRVKSIVEPGP